MDLNGGSPADPGRILTTKHIKSTKGILTTDNAEITESKVNIVKMNRNTLNYPFSGFKFSDCYQGVTVSCQSLISVCSEISVVSSLVLHQLTVFEL